MRDNRSAAWIMGAMLVGGLSLGGCATKKYVNEQIAPVAGQVQSHETHLGVLDRTTQDALARADAAGKLAEGKFVYSTVLSDDSMKFGPKTAVLTPEAQTRLTAFAEKLKSENRNVYVEVQGHADVQEGPKDAAYRLGVLRAEAVRRFLNQQGVALNRISTISYGADAPVSADKTRAGHAANRRVVLIVLA
jgi:peptidoglycan-associated lipoprotein